jgi:hypothetical protein
MLIIQLDKSVLGIGMEELLAIYFRESDRPYKIPYGNLSLAQQRLCTGQPFPGHQMVVP